ncbi:hypothetical protein CK203_054277 [Vitis vinifera]|uniref:Integrase catalytic domain-containing protein n=1 Tax=Vitis vinifera TaxID=29760 RepID=A0A438GYX1_VITVI|nr:hypothetical protein CK203_054277 [Vitis vinifera]
MKKEAAAYVKRCDKCQRYAPIPHMPSTTLNHLRSMALRTVGMDIVRPLPTAPAQKNFCLLPQIISVSGWKLKHMLAPKIGCHQVCMEKYYLPFWNSPTIIADNGPQFDSIAFRNFCSELNIRNSYSTPRYPQSNGQAEATNKTLITALKKRLEQAKGKWVEELPRRPMGLPNYTRTANRKYSFRSCIWNGRRHSYRNRKKFGWTDEVREARPSGWQIITKGISTLQSQSETKKLKNETSVRSCLTSPSVGLSHLLPHAGGRPLIPPDSLPQPNPPGGLHFFSNGG